MSTPMDDISPTGKRIYRGKAIRAVTNAPVDDSVLQREINQAGRAFEPNEPKIIVENMQEVESYVMQLKSFEEEAELRQVFEDDFEVTDDESTLDGRSSGNSEDEEEEEEEEEEESEENKAVDQEEYSTCEDVTPDDKSEDKEVYVEYDPASAGDIPLPSDGEYDMSKELISTEINTEDILITKQDEEDGDKMAQIQQDETSSVVISEQKDNPKDAISAQEPMEENKEIPTTKQPIKQSINEKTSEGEAKGKDIQKTKKRSAEVKLKETPEKKTKIDEISKDILKRSCDEKFRIKITARNTRGKKTVLFAYVLSIDAEQNVILSNVLQIWNRKGISEMKASPVNIPIPKGKNRRSRRTGLLETYLGNGTWQCKRRRNKMLVRNKQIVAVALIGKH